MNLHEDMEEFQTYVSSASQYVGLPEVYVEKDYWVTRSLQQVAQSAFKESVVFKGGTSLSKAHSLIPRFSEDIDFAIIAEGFGDAKRKGLMKSVEEAAAEGLVALPKDERTSKGSKYRKTVYRYPRLEEGGDFGHASPEILLEMNTFTKPEPMAKMTIQSMIAETLIRNGMQDLVSQYGLNSFEINVLSVERTLVEKILGMIKDSYSTEPVDVLKKRIRHLYDIHMILKDSRYVLFIGTREFQEICDSCVADEITMWGRQKTAYLKPPLHEAPLFANLEVWWKDMERTYSNDFASLVYGDLPDSNEIIGTIKEVHKALGSFS